MTPLVPPFGSRRSGLRGRRPFVAAVLGTITDLVATAGDTTAVATWTDVSGATSYQPRFRLTGAGTWTEFGSAIGTGVETVTFTGLTNGSAYEFSVVASDVSTTTTSNVDGATPTAGVALAYDLDENLPAGLTLRTYNPHDASWGTGWSYAERDAAKTNVTRITDATAPSPITVTGQTDDANTGSSVINQDWAGVGDGESPDFLYWTAPGGVTHIFVSTIMYVTSNLVPTNEVKGLEWIQPGESSIWLGIYPTGNVKNPSPNPPAWVLVSRTGSDTQTLQVGDGVSIPLDEWCKVQYEVRLSPLRARVWINGVLSHTEEGASMTFGATTAFGEFQQGAVWGGGNGVAAPTGALMKYAATAIWTN